MIDVDPGRSRPLLRTASVIVPVAVAAALSPFREDVDASSAVLVLVLLVVAAAATGDRWSGVLAALSGALSFDFLLTAPYLSLSIHDPADVEAAVLLLVIGVAVTEVALWGRRQQAESLRRSGYLEGLADVAGAVAGGRETRAVTGVVAERIAEVLGADDCVFREGPVHDARVAVLDRDGVLTRDGRPWDVDRNGLPTDEYVAVPVVRGDVVLGHFLVTSSTRVRRPGREQRRVAALLADQVAPAFDVRH
ncbi:DUF4118 domain-containing protein [Nocardioides sp. C4-1]|uniref:DUF4118 domain-containing protein n=1 Tax=Nocardioides sp. C4-1 TaxID=3151851 RepID=UPI003266E99F